MIIQINNQYRVSCDTMNFTIEKLVIPKDETKEPRWDADGYFRDLDQCYNELMDPKRCVSDSEAKGVTDLMNYTRGLHDEFIQAVTSKTYLGSQKDCIKVFYITYLAAMSRTFLNAIASQDRRSLING